jgi:hypothetical protein
MPWRDPKFSSYSCVGPRHGVANKKSRIWMQNDNKGDGWVSKIVTI